MLVLTRKKGEKVLVGDDIVVTVIDVRGDGVRIGFDAPRGIPIQRAEVVTAVTEANEEAVKAGAAGEQTLVGLLAAAKRAPEPAAEPTTPEPTPAPAAESPATPPKPRPNPSMLARPRDPSA